MEKKLSKKYIKENENELRQRLVNEALSCLGTPYRIRGQIKGVGLDCMTLLIQVYSAAGLIDWFPAPFYRPDFSFHSHIETYLEGVKKFGHEVKDKKPGDIILYRFAKLIDHAAIVIDEKGTMIDTCVTRGCTIQDYNQEINKKREVCTYSFWK